MFDVEGDGDLDVVTSPPHTLLRNDGTGVLSIDASVTISSSDPNNDYLGLGIADVDLDGDTDLTFAFNHIGWSANNG